MTQPIRPSLASRVALRIEPYLRSAGTAGAVQQQLPW